MNAVCNKQRTIGIAFTWFFQVITGIVGTDKADLIAVVLSESIDIKNCAGSSFSVCTFKFHRDIIIHVDGGVFVVDSCDDQQ